MVHPARAETVDLAVTSLSVNPQGSDTLDQTYGFSLPAIVIAVEFYNYGTVPEDANYVISWLYNCYDLCHLFPIVSNPITLQPGRTGRSFAWVATPDVIGSGNVVTSVGGINPNLPDPNLSNNVMSTPYRVRSPNPMGAEVVSPAEGSSVNSTPVDLEVRTFFDYFIRDSHRYYSSPGTQVVFYAYRDGGPTKLVGTLESNNYGYATVSFPADSIGLYHWYTVLKNPNAPDGESAISSFTFTGTSQPTPNLNISLISPSDKSTILSSPVSLEVKVSSQGYPIAEANLDFALDGMIVCQAVSTNSSGQATCEATVSPGPHSWSASAGKSGYGPVIVGPSSFNFTPGALSVEIDGPEQAANGFGYRFEASVTSSGSPTPDALVSWAVSPAIGSPIAGSGNVFEWTAPNSGSGTVLIIATASLAGYPSGSNSRTVFHDLFYDVKTVVTPASPEMGTDYNVTVTLTNMDLVAHTYDISLIEPSAFFRQNPSMIPQELPGLEYLRALVGLPGEWKVNPRCNGQALEDPVTHEITDCPGRTRGSGPRLILPGQKTNVTFTFNNEWQWIAPWDPLRLVYKALFFGLYGGLSLHLLEQLKAVPTFTKAFADFLTRLAGFNWAIPSVIFSFSLDVNGEIVNPSRFPSLSQSVEVRVPMWKMNALLVNVFGPLLISIAMVIVSLLVPGFTTLFSVLGFCMGVLLSEPAYVIAADPPDDEFASIVQPRPLRFVNGTELTQSPLFLSLDQNGKTLARMAADLVSYQEASSTSMSRYSTALKAANRINATAQLQAAVQYSRLRDMSWGNFTTSLDQSIPSSELVIDESGVLRAQQIISSQGLPEPQVRLLDAFGRDNLSEEIVKTVKAYNHTILGTPSVSAELVGVQPLLTNQTAFLSNPGAPILYVVSPLPSVYPRDFVDLAFVPSEPLAWAGYSLDDAPIVTTTAGLRLTDLSEGQHVLLIYANDTSGLSAFPSRVVFTIDTSSPEIVSSQEGLSYVLRQSIQASVECTDAISDIDTCTTSTKLLDTSTVGPHSYTAYSTDKAGNNATLTVHYNVRYNFIPGSPQPSNVRFQLGRTVSLRFQLTDASGNFISAATAQIWVDSLTSPGKSSGFANMGNYFRYDLTDNQYAFNLSTKGMTIGVHVIYITVDDGTFHVTTVNLRS